ncbi:MAG: peptidase E [Bdellovibrionales bacterium]|nr:peptidase E [Bdellovibrionales bacterium]
MPNRLTKIYRYKIRPGVEAKYFALQREVLKLYRRHTPMDVLFFADPTDITRRTEVVRFFASDADQAIEQIDRDPEILKLFKVFQQEILDPTLSEISEEVRSSDEINGGRNIVAMGGGGFSMEPDNPLLDKYVLALTGKMRPKICFVGTASGDAQGYIDNFYKAFSRLECEPTHLSLFRGTSPDLAGLVLSQDVVYVGGGNTRNMLALWREWGLDQILRQAWERGVILCGISAGSICWFDQGVTDSIPGQLSALDGLGFLPESNCPHYDGEKERRPAYHRLVKDGQIQPGLAADDGVAFHFVGQKLAYVVSSNPEKSGYRIDASSGQVSETKLASVFLGNCFG